MRESPDSIPLEADVTVGDAAGGADRRPRIPEPLPVRLVSVEDVRLPAARRPGLARRLSRWPARLGAADENGPAYHAENHTLRFNVTADRPLPHESLRPQGIEVLSLEEIEKELIERELQYTRERGTTPGRETLLLLDPAGNWIEIGEIRLIM